MVPITNYEVYDTRMRKSLIDKAFFLDKTDAEVFVDFGCADGALIELMATLFPEYSYFGYDNDSTMVDLARKRFTGKRVDVSVNDDWEVITGALSYLNKKSCLILSSVIHEVYNYSNDHDIDEFWDQVTNSGFDYVVIRDMARSWYEIDQNFNTTEIEPQSAFQIVEHVRYVCRRRGWTEHLAQFEAEYGSIEWERNLYHFLLKYRYTENWDRELEEDYFITSTMLIQNQFPMREWDCILHENFGLQYNTRQIKKDFDFVMKRPTHTKMIFERK